jgi:hypothetical protein
MRKKVKPEKIYVTKKVVSIDLTYSNFYVATQVDLTGRQLLVLTSKEPLNKYDLIRLEKYTDLVGDLYLS